MIFSLCTCQCFHEVRYVDLHNPYVSSAEKPKKRNVKNVAEITMAPEKIPILEAVVSQQMSKI